ncbi:F-box domain-containing protein [Mycena kentingensis (nom. inval.)]|nr:F-box domain-containing protein [Mycena kentingensis (nom. inval.)]
MHHCLEIAEIVSTIFSHLNGHATTLANLACTCKLFTPPACAELWRVQSNICNIIKCLPIDCFQDKTYQQGRNRSYKTIEFTRTVTEQEWDAVLNNQARHVREFRTICWNKNYALQAHLLHGFQSLPVPHLFPNLRSLDFRPEDTLPHDACMKYLRMLVCPRLVSIDIHLERYHSRTEQQITQLMQLELPLSTLNELSIFIRIGGPHSAIRAVSSFYALRLSNIRSPPAPLPANPPPFPALYELHLYDTTVGFALELLTSSRAWDIAGFTMGSSEPEGRGMLQSLYTAIASHILPANLETLWVGAIFEGDDMKDPPLNNVANYAVLSEPLRQFGSFTGLTEVSIQPPAGLLLSDALLLELARAWPHLSALQLRTASDIQVRPTATLAALRGFAKHCPDLASLQIALDASTASSIPAFDTYRDDPAPQHELCTLNLGVSPLRTWLTRAAARFISGHFPALESIETLQDWRWTDNPGYEPNADREEQEEKEFHERWMEVERMLALCRDVREEEQYFMSAQAA